ncbi:MAG: sigma-70 family RNA polymerase sigma factor [Spirochaetaceae bacterium]|jgi:RNA polymerase sigma-70 factor (ECF subfamily)|nr:sigma-70 family RNA polymerase sigma factor [Spirochaetaceae bacterium]
MHDYSDSSGIDGPQLSSPGATAPAGLREDALAGGERGKQAFRLLWESYYRRLTVFARAYRGLPAADAEDAVSDAMIKVFTGFRRYDPERPLTPWIYRIAANCFSDAAKRARRISPIPVGVDGGNKFREGDSPVIEPAVPDLQVTGLEERELLEQCRRLIDGLEEPDRRIAFLRFFEGFNSAQIGKILKLPAGTVRWRINRIRKHIAASTGEV